MALRDHYGKADILDTLSWTGMTDVNRCAKLATMYLSEEPRIRQHSHKYSGPTTHTVRVFVKNYYIPPQGQMMIVVHAVMDAISHQKAKQNKRESNRPWVWPKKTVANRRDAVAASLVTVWSKNYQGEREKVSTTCKGIGKIADVRILVIDGGYRAKPRIYMRGPEGGIKVVVVDGDRLKSVTQAMLRLAPKMVLRRIFGGETVNLDMDREGFEIGDLFYSWRRVIRVYHGAEAAHCTDRTPSKVTDALAE